MFIDRCFPIEKFDLTGMDMDRLFSEIFPMPGTNSAKVKSPKKRANVAALDMIDKGASIAVMVDVPGFKKEDIEISIEKNTLKLTGKRSVKDEYKDEDFYHMERNHAGFERTVVLPVKIDSDNIRASLKDGLLEITLSKAKERVPKKIKVEAS
jgi:HSP20 family protein